MRKANSSSRRRFLKVGGASTAAVAMLPDWTIKGAPAIVASAAERPQALQGLHFGDPHGGAVVVWSRSDRPARMLVEWSYDEQFNESQRIVGPHALDVTDFTARQDLTGLEPGSDVFVRVTFRSLDNDRAISDPVTRRLVVPPGPLTGEGHMLDHARTDLRFQWSGDTAGARLGDQYGLRPPFLHPQRRHHLCRRADCVLGCRGQRSGVEQHRHAGGSQGRRNAQRVPRPPPLQPARRERAGLQRRGSADLAVGRSRGHEQLVGFQESGGPKGRELEIAELLSHLKRQRVHNVIWLTADVHYCAAHYYDPARAAFHDFDGFWEFVSGPLNAGTFGPNSLDGTFGPQVVFVKAPPPGRSNLSPYSGLQFFGEVNIASQGEEMTVDLRDINGVSVFSRTLQPRRG
jgi:phosphodiesterase/alkaline phosphatase D-like protein